MRRITSLLPLAALVAVVASSSRAEPKADPSPGRLDAVMRVKVDDKLVVSCQFDLPGKKDQSFQNTEYRYAVLDKDGVLVEGAVEIFLPLRTISLPKDKRSVTDKTDAKIVKDKLTSGEQYFFVVSARNLTGLAKFKAP